jgi:hypothetical protein
MRAKDPAGVNHDYVDDPVTRDGATLYKTFCGREFRCPFDGQNDRLRWWFVFGLLTCPECSASSGPAWHRQYVERRRRYEAEHGVE